MAQPPNQPAADGAPFVRNIVEDPKNVPDVMLLYGYLGASSEEDHHRLYLSQDLTNYVEVPKKAVLHQMAAPKEQDPHGGVTVWVKKDAALIYKMAPAAQALAHFFAGAIQAGAIGAGAAPQPTPALTIGACTVAQALCQTAVGPLCTHANTCGIDCSIVCPTHPPRATCAAQCSHITPCLVTHIGQPTCEVQCTQVAPCPTHVATCPPHLSCGIDCTVVGPACQTHHVTCAQVCTVGVVCHPTRAEPQCPFPTEVTCVAVCQASPAPFCGPNITAGACGQSIACVPGGQQEQAARCFGGTALATVPIVCTPACSVVCPTQQGWVCGSHHTPCCPVPVHTLVGATCGFVCGSQQSLCCPVSGGAFCPPGSLACPPGSFACNPGMPGPGGQAQAFCAGGTFNMTIVWWCAQTQNPNFCRPQTHNTPCCPM